LFEKDPVDERIITRPNVNEFVFVRMRFTSESFNLFDEIHVTLLENQVYFLPYDTIKSFI